MTGEYDDPPTQRPADGSARPSATAAPTIVTGDDGRVWHVGPDEEPDRFLLTGTALVGSEGVTWRAHYAGDLDSPVPLAIKQLNRPPGAGPDWPSPTVRRRWQDHRILLQSIPTPHVVPVTDVFLGAPPHEAVSEAPPGVIPYVVMPWIEGPTLAQHAGGSRATARSLPERLGLVRDLADAVGALHTVRTNALIHRDIKPGNCIVTSTRGLVLVDLGSLRLTGDGADDLGTHTPEYAAPEVLADPRAPRQSASDMFSLGAVAYFALLGVDPPSASDPGYVEAAGDQIAAVAAAANVPDPAAFRRHLLTALDVDPGRRPADPIRWAAELERLARRGSSPLRWAWLVVAAIVLVAVTAVVTRTWGMPAPAEEPLPANSFASPVPSKYGVRITAPTAEQNVPQCRTISGVAELPAGKTIVLAMRNLSNGDPVRYLEPVGDWEQPQKLGRWQGVQYFGDGDSSVGQEYTIEVLVVDLAVAKASGDAAEKAGELWLLRTLPKGWELASAVNVHRITGAGTDC